MGDDWKSRAKPVTGTWRDRATPVKEERPWYALDPKNLGSGLVEGVKKIDEYTGAPVRKAVTEAITGEELKKAPTGPEQAAMMGAPTMSYGERFNLPNWVPGRDISPADIYGVPLEVIQDPTMALGALSKLVSKPGVYVADKAATALQKLSNALFENATGATGKQLEKKFAPNAGNQLYKMGLISAGDNPGNIAEKTAGALKKSGDEIGSVLKEVDVSGPKISLVEYSERVDDIAKKLRSEGSFEQADSFVKQASQVIDNANKMELDEVPASFMENVKRESQGSINYTADNKPTMAGKKGAASLQRQVVEEAAEKVSPAIGQKFKDEKALYKLVAPIEEAARARSSQQSQISLGGLLDTASAAGGIYTAADSDNPLKNLTYGLGGIIGRRALLPRVTSTLGAGAYKSGEALRRIPDALKRAGDFALPASATSAYLRNQNPWEIQDEQQ